ncbi:MAG TPA: hypothetical protein VKB56_02655 [Terriglobales bacterium]|nr:hypothetical protein [Terriglobales bacterium]
MSESEAARPMLRHAVATLAYRAAKAVRGAPDGFANFRIAETSRTPAQILAHMGDLFDWALSIARGAERWYKSEPRAWEKEVERFFASLEAFDQYLGSGEPLHAPVEKLFQGPVADALTHTGQLTMLRRAAGAAIRGENYFRAEIATGQVGMAQAAAQREFD